MDPITLSKNDEFFIAVAKQGLHTFMMLGVMKDGAPKLLARVGKTDNIDPNFSNKLSIFKQEMSKKGSLARLADEGIIRPMNHIVEIFYQAYAINFEQAKDFLGLIAAVEENQSKNELIQKRIAILYKKPDDKDDSAAFERAGISAYVPVNEVADGNQVTFEYKKLKDCRFVPKVKPDALKSIQKNVEVISIGTTTCRTTAINMVEAILGFITDISRWFLISPKHQTKLTGGQPDQKSFYILPPPNSFEHKSHEQSKILMKLYKRMDEVATKNPESEKTRAKFDKLKETYLSIAGSNDLNANDLLFKIVEIEKSEENKKGALFQTRGSLSEFFGLATTTENMFRTIKEDLQQKIKKNVPDKQDVTNKPTKGSA